MKKNLKYYVVSILCGFMWWLICPLFSFSQTTPAAKQDTLNRTDENGLKQGFWIITNATKNLPDFGSNDIVEQVNYVDGKKEGIRKLFFPGGKVKSETTFQNNIPKGHAKVYYSNGNLSEEGNWRNGGWDGIYKYFYEDGNQCYEWNFKDGKREGEQKYFHPNGELNYIGVWKDGNESGVLKEFNESGQLVAEKNFNDGKMDEASTKYYNPAPAAPLRTAPGPA